MDAQQLVATWRDGALVLVEDGSVRAAAFVFVDVDGITWVEPSYADPWGTPSPSMHRREGAPAVVAHWIEVGCVTAIAFESEIHEGDDGGALLWFARYLKEAGTTWEAERDRVSRMLDL